MTEHNSPQSENELKPTKYIILWGNGEWEGHTGTLESAIERAKEAYWNYGHLSARIIPYYSLYYVRNEMIETHQHPTS